MKIPARPGPYLSPDTSDGDPWMRPDPSGRFVARKDYDALAARLAEAETALRAIVRAADEAKEPCGSDPESSAAIRNGKFATLAQMAAQGLGWVKGPPLGATDSASEAQP